MLVGPYGLQCQGSVFQHRAKNCRPCKVEVNADKAGTMVLCINEHSGINEADRARSLRWYWLILQKKPQLTKSYQQL